MIALLGCVKQKGKPDHDCHTSNFFRTKELPTPQTQIVFAHTAGLPVRSNDAQDKLQDRQAEGALRDMQ
jgi:hypothetical protein